MPFASRKALLAREGMVVLFPFQKSLVTLGRGGSNTARGFASPGRGSKPLGTAVLRGALAAVAVEDPEEREALRRPLGGAPGGRRTRARIKTKRGVRGITGLRTANHSA